MKKLLTYLFLIFLLASCEEQTDWELKTTDMASVVVDGIITNELKTQTLTLTKPVTGLNEEPQPVAGATVLVSSDEDVYSFHESQSKPGTYISDEPFNGLSGKIYSLLITTGSAVYSAKAELAAPANSVYFLLYQQNGGDNKYRISWVADAYSPVDPAMYEILLDWSLVQGYENSNPDSCKAKLFYYTLPTIDVSEVFAPALEKTLFPLGTLITERRYSLTTEHASFIRALLLETTWQGGFFNTASANIPTNISDGGKGFFGACGVVEMHGIVK
jgi:hypothetical protein